uniref:Uncharacterized protein n=1 Tax=Desertifilum tharense IPPAS B-1220 TaxID=1781255 RepID=A0ACD5GU64_9CYAN
MIGNRPKANPFAVSRAMTLDGLQPDGMAALAGAQVENPQALALAIWDWTRGQPFLTQKLYSLVHLHLGAGILRKGEETHLLEQMVQTQVIEAWEAQDRPVHFRAIRDRLFPQPAQLNDCSSFIREFYSKDARSLTTRLNAWNCKR